MKLIDMENLNRMVIDLYKRCFTDYVNGSTIDADSLMESLNIVNYAIDKAVIGNQPTEELEQLKNDIEYLKYKIL